MRTVADLVPLVRRHTGPEGRSASALPGLWFMRHVRLERARQLMLADGLTAQQAADRVGYASAAHFTRDFKRQFGLAPRAYTRAFTAGSGKIVAAAPTTAASRAAP